MSVPNMFVEPKTSVCNEVTLLTMVFNSFMGKLVLLQGRLSIGFKGAIPNAPDPIARLIQVR